MNVHHIMRPATVWLTQNAGLSIIVQTLIGHRPDPLPIVDAAEHVVGVIFPADLLHLFFPRFDDLLRDYNALEDKGQLSSLFTSVFSGVEMDDNRLILAADIMRTHLIWVGQDESILSAASRLFGQRIKTLPVVDRDRRLMGLVSEADVVAALLKGSSSSTLSR